MTTKSDHFLNSIYINITTTIVLCNASEIYFNDLQNNCKISNKIKSQRQVIKKQTTKIYVCKHIKL